MSADAVRSADSVNDRRERLVRPLLIAFLVASAVDLVGVLADVPVAHLLAKPLLMPLLAGYAAARRGPRLLIAALLFGWGGDTLLLPDSDTAFLIGMGSFAAGHVCYLWLFGRARSPLLAGIVYAAVLATFVALLWDGLPPDLRIPMTGYSLLLTTMAYRAGTLGRYAAVGGALFLLSDALIATGIADWPQLPAPDFWVMLTYIAAQFLLTVGALAPGGRTKALIEP
ncbi:MULTISPECIES: lysoplasmalogenase [unclassified Streptomyces]|uniref:lysoplasmalogenase n=1 Tax=unclassified Streptomyces TaxID=2593676 RepID=UPI00225144CC|nr:MULTISPECIES: lysoplasmalogenase [unclassified Streptomyces]WSP54334.1 lysoplasmalogenase [Streptomyces sp. NBC_01241]WSU24991.1 lysoplasmalogenase [Streptomyces sp. NBC_01108]MCX4785854.1 lysoplasmalogenase [Streptomyces sp. NBC_01221]MCX4798287.1 lysoplasmalogenase [Streptomyces sp. NBC_01242]WSJ39526.1 lysoplasmalogenase [Streptomyces sp. NBC_01321]